MCVPVFAQALVLTMSDKRKINTKKKRSKINEKKILYNSDNEAKYKNYYNVLSII